MSIIFFISSFLFSFFSLVVLKQEIFFPRRHYRILAFIVKVSA